MAGWMSQGPAVVIVGGVVVDDGGLLQTTPELAATELADGYRSNHGKRYVAPEREGFCDIPVLEFLWGQPWDQLALNYVHALRPSSIRVIEHHGFVTADAAWWRVDVRLHEDNRTIHSICQSVNVGLIGVQCGWGLETARQRRLTAPPVPSAPFAVCADCTNRNDSCYPATHTTCQFHRRKDG